MFSIEPVKKKNVSTIKDEEELYQNLKNISIIYISRYAHIMYMHTTKNPLRGTSEHIHFAYPSNSHILCHFYCQNHINFFFMSVCHFYSPPRTVNQNYTDNA